MKKILIFITIAAIAIFFTACEKESPTAEQPIAVETVQPVYLDDNPENPEIPEATVKLENFVKHMDPVIPTTTNPATLEPAVLNATLKSGEIIGEHKILTLPADVSPPKADIMFALDLTGSMGGEINNAKANSINIMNALRGLIPDTYFGSISYMDYPSYYNSCGYGSNYGSSYYDYPYRLDQGLTDNTGFVATAINSLSMGSGWDGPESYNRVFWESWNDTNINWRTGAKRFLINWGDAIPHDCDVYLDCTGWGTRTTGVDPGRDAIAGTADDLDLAVSLQGMADNNIALLALHSGGSYYLPLWDCYASKTGAGGDAVLINYDGTIPGGINIAEYIASLVEEAIKTIDHLKLEICTPGFEGWLINAGAEYTDIYLDDTKTFDFDIEIMVPVGTEDGEYCFEICAVGDGVIYATQEVCITVKNVQEVPFDVKPTSCPNPFNMNAKGTLPAAILGTADFDVTTIDPETVQLEGVSALRWELEDVAAPYTGDEPTGRNDCTTDGPDGFTDITFKFDHQEVAAALGAVNDGDEVVVTVTGQLLDGTPLIGVDIIWIKKKK